MKNFKWVCGSLFLILGLLAWTGCSSNKTPTSPQDTPTNTPVPFTPTNTFTPTPTGTPTQTATVTATGTSTLSPTNSMTPTNTATSTASFTATPSGTPTNSFTPTISDTPTNSPTITDTPTITSTPTVTSTWTPCGSGGLFGNQSTSGTAIGVSFPGVLLATLYNYPTGPNGTLRDIQAYYGDDYSHSIVIAAALYTTNSTYPGQPGTLLGNSDPVTCNAAGWYSMNIPGDIPLTSGTPYWICLDVYYLSGTSYSYYEAYSSGAAVAVFNVAPSNGFPTNWPTTGNTSISPAFPFYADYCD